ncbi:hypothetical protein BGW36DRAFT_358706 [Talaromyces proteolyticus]|uniref:Uncharacterized protein n=1 Tax=Talaromyces proteolyticus TaxID=1131652 RepID=A0AAD4KY38_9EURO|nr:uncharacterized protein BGW36DRAFT_358706 [Talaromyces proteolyticus]KAH8699202.1 hypothetical protein BGW36DRAFT_358706 [Talaromyces proteolyticus]
MGLVGGLLKLIIIPILAFIIISLIIVAVVYFSRAKKNKELELEANQFQPPPIQRWVFDPQQQALQQTIIQQQQEQHQQKQQQPGSPQPPPQVHIQYPSPVAGGPPSYYTPATNGHAQ